MTIPSSLRYTPIGAALALALLMSACGGGDSAPEGVGADTESAQSFATSTPGDEASPPPEALPDEPAPGSELPDGPTEDPQAVSIAANCGLSDFAAESLKRINAYRARGASCGSYGTFKPTTPLVWHTALNSAAARHSKDMAANNFFSHTGSDGSNAGTRMLQAGYRWRAWGENIAAGYPSVQSVVDGWMKSPGHCANIMRPTYKEVGLACVKGGSRNTYKTYWTMDLGRR